MAITKIEIQLSGQAPPKQRPSQLAAKQRPWIQTSILGLIDVPADAKTFAVTTRFADGRTTVRSLVIREFASTRSVGANG